MIDEQLLYVTTLITTEWNGNAYSGSGFFYQQATSAMTESSLGNYWLVTNRHVIYANVEAERKKYIVDKLTFRVRVDDKAINKFKWVEVSLTRDELLKNAKVLPDYGIDVAVIDVCTNVEAVLNKLNNIYVTICPITEEKLADKSNLPIEVCDDIMVIGYPRGYYDETNLYPIVKNGTIASMWGADFRESKGFAIDAKLFPGSSGSLVITKPHREDLKDGKYLEFKKEKLYYCLGVYSGEPLFRRVVINVDRKPTVIQYTFDLGLAWYYSLIPDTIKNGGALTDEYNY